MRQDLVGGLGPGEGVAAAVPAVDEGADRVKCKITRGFLAS